MSVDVMSMGMCCRKEGRGVQASADTSESMQWRRKATGNAVHGAPGFCKQRIRCGAEAERPAFPRVSLRAGVLFLACSKFTLVVVWS